MPEATLKRPALCAALCSRGTQAESFGDPGSLGGRVSFTPKILHKHFLSFHSLQEADLAGAGNALKLELAQAPHLYGHLGCGEILAG